MIFSSGNIVSKQSGNRNFGFRFLAEAGLMDTVIEVISGVRSIRGETGIAPSVLLDVVVKTDDPAMRRLVEEHSVYIANLARARRVACIADESERPKKCALAVRKGLEVYVPLEGVVDIEKELERLSKQMKKVEKELGEKRRKLDNPTFLEKAKKEVVEEQERLARELSFELASLQKAFDMLAG